MPKTVLDIDRLLILRRQTIKHLLCSYKTIEPDIAQTYEMQTNNTKI